MKCYRYTIESVGGIVTELKDLPNRIAFDAEVPMITINNPAEEYSFRCVMSFA